MLLEIGKHTDELVFKAVCFDPTVQMKPYVTHVQKNSYKKRRKKVIRRNNIVEVDGIIYDKKKSLQ